MPRRSRFEIVLDTSYFTPDALQHRAFLAMAMNGWARWLREHLGVSFRKIVTEHNAGAVVAGGELEYLEPFTFTDADTIECDVGVKAYRGGAFLRLELDVTGAGKPIARVIGTMRPVLIGGGPGLEAVPGNLPAPLLERFQPDELETGSVRLQVPELVEDVEDSGRLLASVEQPLFIHRHRIEAADQWSFVEFTSFGEIGREALCFKFAKEHPALGAALGRQLKSSRFQPSRPLFVFDEAKLETRAYLSAATGDLVFVHRVTPSIGTQRPNLLGIETLRS